MSRPIISVVMSVYNIEELYLRKSIESILNQTYKDFEFIIVFDCATDNSLSIIQEYASTDSRIKVILNEKNLGLTKSLNLGIEIAKGKYVARMDADDVSLKHRFRQQLSYMEEHPDVMVVGSYAYIGNRTVTSIDMWNRDREICKIQMLFTNAGVMHPSSFIRIELFSKYNIRYDECIKKAQDCQLWVDCLQYGKIDTIPEVLLYRRIHPQQISADRCEQKKYGVEIFRRQLTKLFDVVTEEDLILHSSIFSVMSNIEPRKYDGYFNKLVAANRTKKIYNENIFETQIKAMWIILAYFKLCHYKRFDFVFCKRFLQSIISISSMLHFYKVYITPKIIKKRIYKNFLKNPESKDFDI